MRWRLVLRTEGHCGRHQRVLECLQLALGAIEPVAERADERIELANDAILVGELDLELDDSLEGLRFVRHGATIPPAQPPRTPLDNLARRRAARSPAWRRRRR